MDDENDPDRVDAGLLKKSISSARNFYSGDGVTVYSAHADLVRFVLRFKLTAHFLPLNAACVRRAWFDYHVLRERKMRDSYRGLVPLHAAHDEEKDTVKGVAPVKGDQLDVELAPCMDNARYADGEPPPETLSFVVKEVVPAGKWSGFVEVEFPEFAVGLNLLSSHRPSDAFLQKKIDAKRGAVVVSFP